MGAVSDELVPSWNLLNDFLRLSLICSISKHQDKFMANICRKHLPSLRTPSSRRPSMRSSVLAVVFRCRSWKLRIIVIFLLVNHSLASFVLLCLFLKMHLDRRFRVFVCPWNCTSSHFLLQLVSAEFILGHFPLRLNISVIHNYSLWKYYTFHLLKH